LIKALSIFMVDFPCNDREKPKTFRMRKSTVSIINRQVAPTTQRAGGRKEIEDRRAHFAMLASWFVVPPSGGFKNAYLRF